MTRGDVRFSNWKVQKLPFSSWIVLCSHWVQIFYYKCTSDSLFYVKEDLKYLPLSQSNLVWFSILLFWAEFYISCQIWRVQVHPLQLFLHCSCWSCLGFESQKTNCFQEIHTNYALLHSGAKGALKTQIVLNNKT